MSIFVTHSHQDQGGSDLLAQGLRAAGATVYKDQEDVDQARLEGSERSQSQTEPPQLQERAQELLWLNHSSLVIVLLSPAALASDSVQRITAQALHLASQRCQRVVLPVMIRALEPHDEHATLGGRPLHEFLILEAGEFQPYPETEVLDHLLDLVGLAESGHAQFSRPGRLSRVPALDWDLVQARVFLGLKEEQRAINLLEPLLERVPERADGWGMLSVAYHGCRHYEEAIAANECSLQLDPAQAWVWKSRGNLLRDLHRHEEALAAYDQALALDPTSAVPWYNKGNLLREVQRDEEALAAFDRAVALDPIDADTWRYKGYCLYQLKRYEDALAVLDRANRLNPLDRETMLGIMHTLRKLRRYREIWPTTRQILRRRDEARSAARATAP